MLQKGSIAWGEARELPGWWIIIAILGLYLSLRGYHSLDGDQTFRLPLLLHQQDPAAFADDPFVRAFDTFNPHRGSLLVLDAVTRVLGLSGGLFFIFVLTFVATCWAVDRLARGVWPREGGRIVGLVAVGLFLAAKAGNIGTNHLFEAMVLDRLMALALGWVAMAALVIEPRSGHWRAAVAIAAATLVHPSVGLQLALVLAASVFAWGLVGTRAEMSASSALGCVILLALAVGPGLLLNLGSGRSIQGDMPADVFWLLSVELQSPQHMLPHLWRMPQWLAAGAYLALAALALFGSRPLCSADPDRDENRSFDLALGSPARLRLGLTLAVILIALGIAWYAIEVRHLVSVTVFQPFRMATVARGMALMLVSGRLVNLWRSGTGSGRLRAVMIATAFTSDWLLVVTAFAELAVSAVEAVRVRLPFAKTWGVADLAVLLVMLALGFNFLAHHDTEYGHIPLLGAFVTALVIQGFTRWRGFTISPGSPRSWSMTPAWRSAPLVAAWIVPLASLLAAAVPLDHRLAADPFVRGLIARCRFAAVPADDIERLGLWCREHIPTNARLVGPPGPKTLRLWSRRSVAFSRSASPYDSAGLADWFTRFQDHVNFRGDPADFVRSYVKDRHGFEGRYQAQSDADRAALAQRQGADYVVAAAPVARKNAAPSTTSSPFELLHVEGRYAVYRVKPELLVQRQR